MSDDTFSFGMHEKTEVEGPIKVKNVVPVDVSDTPGTEHLADPDSYVEPEATTIWLKTGDVFHKDDSDVGLFKVTVIKIVLVEKTDGSDDYYKADVKHEPLISGSEEVDESRMPVITTQNLRGFAQEALTFDPIDDAGKAPEEREGDNTTEHPTSTESHGAEDSSAEDETTD